MATIFLEDENKSTDRIMKIGKAEGILRLREEMRKLKNTRIKPKTRDITKDDFEEIEIKRVRRKDCSGRRDTGVLRSYMVDNMYVQDKGEKIQIVGSDVEALYPSLHAVEVAEIVYEAVLKTKIKFQNIDWMEGCKYVALTSTEQECRLGPLRRVLPRRRATTGTRPGITGEDQ